MTKTTLRLSDQALSAHLNDLESHGPYNATIPTHELEALVHDLQDSRVRVAELEGRVRELEGERDEAYRKGLEEALRMGEANAATLYIDLAVHTPSEATKNMLNGVNVALFPIKRDLEVLDRARAALGEK